jgi:N-acetylglucosaminyldiphosphoundecaprenol N-acetyl-beta-D-mannosaminyltransferase
MLQDYNLFNQSLSTIGGSKVLITTINAYSYNTVNEDEKFQKALKSSDILLPDGISVVWAMRLLTGKKIKKIAGEDLFIYEMERVNAMGGSCFFLGSSNTTLQLIKKRISKEYPKIKAHFHSPPYKPEFTTEDSRIMVEAINTVKPDVLFVGMTAPKQEKWACEHFNQLEVGHTCCIGAVFDFYAGTVKRAPNWMIRIGMEWFYRLIKEPKRLWRRYLIGNAKFVESVLMEKLRF